MDPPGDVRTSRTMILVERARLHALFLFRPVP